LSQVDADGNGQVRLAQAGRTDEYEGPPISDKTGVQVALESLPSQLRPEPEVELLQGRDEGEVRLANQPGNSPLFSGSQFVFEQTAQEIRQTVPISAGLVDTVLENIANAAQMQFA
jgi:hypothetical protein